MILSITGTPGTGKTTLSKLVAGQIGAEIVHISDFATDEVTESIEGETRIVNTRKLEEKIKNHVKGDAVIDGHLTSGMAIGDIIIVLRTDPKVLEGRLVEKGFGEEKIKENLEAEALDACLVESMERHKNVFEIDTTKKRPTDLVEDMLKIIDGEGEAFSPGKIDWSEMFF